MAIGLVHINESSHGSSSKSTEYSQRSSAFADEKEKLTMKKSIFTKFATLAMACVMAFSVSAGALDVTTTYTTALSVESTVPHDLDFFSSQAAVTDNEDGTQDVSIKLGDTATVTVTIGGAAYTATGSVSGASSNTTGYTAAVENGYLVVTCEEDVDVDDFSANITFSVSLDSGTHKDVAATLTLS